MSDQELVLGYLQSLKRNRHAAQAAPVQCGRNPEIKLVDGLLVFTGEVEDNPTDWIKVVREERDEEIMQQKLGQNDRR